MKAAILESKGVMTYKEVPTPSPKAGHVRLQVKAVSICGSDIKRYISGHREYPMILGHECGGIIDCVGEGVDTSLIGKHASVIPLVPCFECTQCKRGLYSACTGYSFIGSRQAGCYADFVELPLSNVLISPESLSFEQLALVEPATVARHMLDMGNFQAGQGGLVFGVGSIGLMVVQWLRILQAKTILSADISDENLEMAKNMGANIPINLKRDDIEALVRQHTGDGVDVSFESAGVPQTLLQSISVTRPRGKVVFAGNQPVEQSIPLSFIENMMRRELSLVGNHMSYSAPWPGHEWVDVLAVMQRGDFQTDSLISHRFSLAETPEVFAKIKERSLHHLKIILVPEAANA
jgi:L-iditol 2-dehydrogenase